MTNIFDSRELHEEDEYLAEQAVHDVEVTLNDLQERFERRYKTGVTAVALAGYVGTWRGQFPGGITIGDHASNVFRPFNNCEIRVEIGDAGQLKIIGTHHDGQHVMNLHFITEGKRKRLGLPHDPATWLTEDFEKLLDRGAPVKVDKEFKRHYGLTR